MQLLASPAANIHGIQIPTIPQHTPSHDELPTSGVKSLLPPHGPHDENPSAPPNDKVTSTAWEDILAWVESVDLSQLDCLSMTYYPDVDEPGPSASGLGFDDKTMKGGVEEETAGRVGEGNVREPSHSVMVEDVEDVDCE
jgi:hypothetical protein